MISRAGSVAMVLMLAVCVLGCNDAGSANAQTAAGKGKAGQRTVDATSTAACPFTASSPKSDKACPAFPGGMPPTNGAMTAEAMMQHGSEPTFAGKVIETMQASRYTYVLVESGTNQVWAAAPQFQVAKGDNVVVPIGMPMRGFHSSTLNRTFDTLYMTAKITVTAPATAPAK
jgi:hypothetical protein